MYDMHSFLWNEPIMFYDIKLQEREKGSLNCCHDVMIWCNWSDVLIRWYVLMINVDVFWWRCEMFLMMSGKCSMYALMFWYWLCFFLAFMKWIGMTVLYDGHFEVAHQYMSSICVYRNALYPSK